jgi:hypothetical protein
MPRRFAAMVATLLATMVGASACGGLSVANPPTATASAKATTAPPATGSAGPSPSATSKAPTTYPATAQAYGQKTLTAWGAIDVQTLSDLTTADAQAQLNALVIPPNQPWNFQTCDGAAGSTYCAYASNDGDVITLRMVNSVLGKAHAVAEVKFDPTVYATDATGYVKEFIEAWRDGNTRRMLALSSQAEVDYFTHFTPPDTYVVCGLRSGDVWSERIYNAAGLNYVVKVADPVLGNRHAITGHVDPVVGPPICS